MSLWADYIREREGKEIIETDEGFVTYEISGESLYLVDMYVRPELRKTGVAKAFAEEITRIAKKQGCKRLLTTVATNAAGVTISLKVILSYGFEFMQVAPGLLWFKKEI
jgi:GNAT superfamily N-acetyltransferase